LVHPKTPYIPTKTTKGGGGKVVSTVRGRARRRVEGLRTRHSRNDK